MIPLVSIISPTYNHEKYIAECIQSAQSQTFENWEMLIINDGSTDRTAEIAAAIASNDARVKLFNRENVGIFRLAETYNFALSQAQGKYIAILEGDDLWEKDKLEKQVAILESHSEYVLAWGVAQQVDASKSKVYAISPDVNDQDAIYFENQPLGSILNILFYRNCIPALTLLIRKEMLDQIGGFRQGYGLPLVDLPTLHQLSIRGAFYFDKTMLGSWRIYPMQTTKTQLVPIYKGFADLVFDNYKAFSALPGVIFNVDLKALKIYFAELMIVGYSRSGRYKLIRKEFKAARKDYIQSLRLPGGAYLWKLRSLVGLFFSWFHLDIEWLAQLLKRKTYKNSQ